MDTPLHTFQISLHIPRRRIETESKESDVNAPNGKHSVINGILLFFYGLHSATKIQ